MPLVCEKGKSGGVRGAHKQAEAKRRDGEKDEASCEKEVQLKDLELARKDEEIDGSKKALALAVRELEELDGARMAQRGELVDEEIPQYQDPVDSIRTENGCSLRDRCLRIELPQEERGSRRDHE